MGKLEEAAELAGEQRSSARTLCREFFSALPLSPQAVGKAGSTLLITADFAYVRWSGDRKGIERVTKTRDKTVVDRRGDLTNWVELFRKFVARSLKCSLTRITTTHYADVGITHIMPPSELCRIESHRQHRFPCIPAFPRTLMFD
jgi:hypothetical protein